MRVLNSMSSVPLGRFSIFPAFLSIERMKFLELAEKIE